MASGEGPDLLGKVKFSFTRMFLATSCGEKKHCMSFQVSSAVAASIFSQVSFTGVEVCGSIRAV